MNYGFFDAKGEAGNWDRTYTASNFGEYLGSMICDGVQAEYLDAFDIMGGNNVYFVQTGKAWIHGHYLTTDTPYELDWGAAISLPVSSHGWAIAVAYADEDARECGITCVSGGTGDSPISPDNTETLYRTPLWALPIATDSTGLMRIDGDPVDMRVWCTCILNNCTAASLLERATQYDEKVAEVLEPVANLASGYLQCGSVNGDADNTYTLYTSGVCAVYLGGTDFSASTLDWSSMNLNAVTYARVTTPWGGVASLPQGLFARCLAPVINLGGDAAIAGKIRIEDNTDVFASNRALHTLRVRGMAVSYIGSQAFKGAFLLHRLVFDGFLKDWDTIDKADDWADGWQSADDIADCFGERQYIECLDATLCRTAGHEAWSDWENENAEIFSEE